MNTPQAGEPLLLTGPYWKRVAQRAPAGVSSRVASETKVLFAEVTLIGAYSMDTIRVTDRVIRNVSVDQNLFKKSPASKEVPQSLPKTPRLEGILYPEMFLAAGTGDDNNI